MTASHGASRRETDGIGGGRRRPRLHAPIGQPGARLAHGGKRIGTIRTGIEAGPQRLGQEGWRVEQAPVAMQGRQARAAVLGRLARRLDRTQDAGAAANLERQRGRQAQRRLSGRGCQGMQQDGPQGPACSPASHKALACHVLHCSHARPLHCVSASGKVGLHGAPKERYENMTPAEQALRDAALEYHRAPSQGKIAVTPTQAADPTSATCRWPTRPAWPTPAWPSSRTRA